MEKYVQQMQHSLSYWTWCHLHIQGVFLTGTPLNLKCWLVKNNFEKMLEPHTGSPPMIKKVKVLRLAPPQNIRVMGLKPPKIR